MLLFLRPQVSTEVDNLPKVQAPDVILQLKGHKPQEQ